jgi:hypothetical protein
MYYENIIYGAYFARSSDVFLGFAVHCTAFALFK